MFLCLGLALLVDGADGPMARAFDVQNVMPRWSGDTLDLVVDYTTYVFVPAYAISASGLLPGVLADSRRHRCRRQWRSLFRRSRNENKGQLFPWLSGGVEPGSLLSVFA